MYKGKASGKKVAIPAMTSNVTKEFPDKLYVIKSDKKKPYVRLEEKIAKCFDKFMNEYRDFKKLNYKNFEKTTKMLYAMGQEFSLVKTVFDQFQVDAEDRDNAYNTRFQTHCDDNQLKIVELREKTQSNKVELTK